MGNSTLIENENSMKRAEILQEGINGLTKFLVETGKIPSKESILNEYDKIIPDSWDNVRTEGNEILLDTEEMAEQADLLSPVLEKFSYDCSICEKNYSVAVNVDSENKEYQFYVFNADKDWYLQMHFTLVREDEDRRFAITELDPWFVYMFLNIDKKRWKSDRMLQVYLPKDYEKHEELYNITKHYFYSAEEKKRIEDLVSDMIEDFQFLMVYMNHQIDLEVQKREELKKKKDDADTDCDKAEKIHQVENKVVYHENAIKEKRQILIGSMNIHIASDRKTKVSKIIHRKCLCWGVRGHKRIYKNGKVVYIKPYKKGRDKDKIAATSKEYSVASV